MERIRTPSLEIACEISGPADGAPVILLHGWPYDPRTYDAMLAPLAAAGCRVIVPYLRGFGATRFLSSATPRSSRSSSDSPRGPRLLRRRSCCTARPTG